MTIRQIACYEAVCDKCGQACNPGDEGTIHFGSEAEARNDLRQYYEWTHDGDRDLCRECTAADQCEKHGHVPALDAGVKYCDRCEEYLP